METVDILDLLAIADIHFGNDYTYQEMRNELAGQRCTVRGSWGPTVMPMVMDEYESGGYHLFLELGDRISANKTVFDSGKFPYWANDLQNHFARAGRGRFLNVQGNHCCEVGDALGFPGIFLGYPPRMPHEDFASSYRDIKGFRIVMSNAGTRQRTGASRFIPPKHMRWLEEVIGDSPYPVILMQHIPPDEFDNGEDFYKRLAKKEMMMMIIHGHRHNPTMMEFPEGLPVLHLQALLFEDAPPLPGGHVAAIHINPYEIKITAKTLMGNCGNERTFRIDRKDLTLIKEPQFEGCVALKADPAPV